MEELKSTDEMTDRELLVEIVETMRLVRQAMIDLAKHPMLGMMTKGLKL